MASNIICALCGLIIATVANLNGVNGQQNLCSSSEFWSSDIDQCVSCSSCKQYPKTPSCNTCTVTKERSDVWRLAAISSFSVLAVILVAAVLIIGVMVHRRKAQKRPLREPIEETTGPLYQA
ncbi:unnamed protein product [Coregonus sp. 'balchen']|uniref:Tumor necrosis factor receptor superfamily member 12A n=1 Tax=Coregonus suidteri TaxID=861788 RepID=A0AAN8MQU2_9TELE|nr:unnamed protein product [Coregonus sp. 'balchen']